jgi:hypothetical protein
MKPSAATACRETRLHTPPCLQMAAKSWCGDTAALMSTNQEYHQKYSKSQILRSLAEEKKSSQLCLDYRTDGSELARSNGQILTENDVESCWEVGEAFNRKTLAVRKRKIHRFADGDM